MGPISGAPDPLPPSEGFVDYSSVIVYRRAANCCAAVHNWDWRTDPTVRMRTYTTLCCNVVVWIRIRIAVRRFTINIPSEGWVLVLLTITSHLFDCVPPRSSSDANLHKVATQMCRFASELLELRASPNVVPPALR